MNLFVINTVLALIWAALIGEFSLEILLAGYILGYLTLYVTRGVTGETTYFTCAARVIRFLFYFLWEMFIANLRVARDVLRPGPLRMQPRVIAIPLDRKHDVAVTLLGNVMSLTPGTLTLDVAEDRGMLFIHAMHSPDREETLQQIKDGFERIVFSLFEYPEETARDSNKGEK